MTQYQNIVSRNFSLLPLNCTLFTWIKKSREGYMSWDFSAHILISLEWCALWNGFLWSVYFDNTNHRCATSYTLINIMDIQTCCVVVAMVTPKSTKCSTWSVRVSSVTLCLLHCAEAKTVKNPNYYTNCLNTNPYSFGFICSLRFYYNTMEINESSFVVLTAF